MNKKPNQKVDSFIRGVILTIGIVDFLLQNYFRKVRLGVENSGISFGLLGNINRLLNAGLLMLLTGVLLYLIIKNKKSLSIFAIFIGGSVNLVSRVFFGGVWDYLYLPLMPFGNNFSDILISFGVIFYLLGF